jgi:ParB family chromosome partitioning protein
MPQSNTLDCPIDHLHERPQVRKHFDEHALDELAQSIQEVGILQPILARKDEERLVVLDGHRRLNAAKRAGLKKVPVIVVEGELTPTEVTQRQLVINWQREDLKPLEKANGIQEFIQNTGSKSTEVARKLGVANGTITKFLALLTLPPPIQAMVDAGQIGPTSAYELTGIEDLSEQVKLATLLASGNLNRDGIARAVKAARRRTPKPSASSSHLSAFGGHQPF